MSYINNFDLYLFDLDGVIYVDNKSLPGSKEALDILRKKHKQIKFLTNNPQINRLDTVNRLKNLKIEAHTKEIITSGWATAQYLSKKNIKNVFVLGNDSLKHELEYVNIETEATKDIQAVVVGWDKKSTLEDIQKAAMYINKGAKFIATNNDKTYPSSVGPLPAVGAIVAALKISTNVNPTIVGKPYPLMFEYALNKKIDLNRVLMIGDTPEIDILGAHKCGISALLFSNDPKAKSLHNKNLEKPDGIISNLMYLFEDIYKY